MRLFTNAQSSVHDLVRWSRFRFQPDYKLRLDVWQYRDLIDSDTRQDIG